MISHIEDHTGGEDPAPVVPKHGPLTGKEHGVLNQCTAQDEAAWAIQARA